jgi:4-amino-4-deoxy-L-arabinose transferase-like glycosyltransferase
MNFNYLTFSDGAKFALIARNLYNGNGFVTDFSFWGNPFFAINGIPRLIPYIIEIFFKLFGESDFAVKMFSSFFFVTMLIAVFLLGKKIFSTLVGILSVLVVGFNYDYLIYSQNGGSETLFAFEIVIGLYFLSFKKNLVNFLGFLTMVAMYFSKPQAFIFIAGMAMYWLINKLNIKKGILMFLGICLAGFFFDKLIIYPYSFTHPNVQSVFGRGMQSILTYSSNSAVSDALRGGISSSLKTEDVFKKVFYNLYNFYKLMPNILNPYLFSLFFIGIFIKSENKLYMSYKISTLFLFSVTLLVTALSIPFYRYIHPIVPLVYILAVGTLEYIISNFQFSNFKQIAKQKYVIPVSIFIILFFAVGQTLGIIILDSRFERKNHNIDKPPVYVELSKILKENSNSDDVVITNLDTWGSWYGERKTIWFPLEPKQLIDPATGEIPFDAIYLTSYLMDDQNYYMGESWREIFLNPTTPSKWTCEGCELVAKEFKLKGVYKVESDRDYERSTVTSILLSK